MVCVKIIRNNKDFLDQSLGEIKLLRYLNANDPHDQMHVVRMFDYFYFREHLFIVCELLRDNLYELYHSVAKFHWPPYFTLARVRVIARQTLTALAFLHSLDLLHCDVKPENVLFRSISRCVVKLIDFGSSSFVSDPHSSYVQSRSYRAPEVALGMPYGQRIDLWSLGCILAEVFTGATLFNNRTVRARPDPSPPHHPVRLPPHHPVRCHVAGKPYMAALTANRGLASTLLLGALLTVLLTTGALPSISDYLELVPLPQGDARAAAAADAASDGAAAAGGAAAAAAASLGSDLLSLMALDFAVCFVAEKGTSWLFASTY